MSKKIDKIDYKGDIKSEEIKSLLQENKELKKEIKRLNDLLKKNNQEMTKIITKIANAPHNPLKLDKAGNFTYLVKKNPPILKKFGGREFDEVYKVERFKASLNLSPNVTDEEIKHLHYACTYR